MSQSTTPPVPQATESRFFGGKLIKWSLPAFHPPFGAPSADIKRLLLPQGELAQVHDGREPIRYLACLDLLANTTRGNHYHGAKREFVYLMRGGYELVAQEVATGEKIRLPIREGELVLVEPGIAHAMVVTAPGVAVEWSPTPFDASDRASHDATGG